MAVLTDFLERVSSTFAKPFFATLLSSLNHWISFRSTFWSGHTFCELKHASNASWRKYTVQKIFHSYLLFFLRFSLRFAILRSGPVVIFPCRYCVSSPGWFSERPVFWALNCFGSGLASSGWTSTHALPGHLFSSQVSRVSPVELRLLIFRGHVVEPEVLDHSLPLGLGFYCFQGRMPQRLSQTRCAGAVGWVPGWTSLGWGRVPDVVLGAATPPRSWLLIVNQKRGGIPSAPPQAWPPVAAGLLRHWNIILVLWRSFWGHPVGPVDDWRIFVIVFLLWTFFSCLLVGTPFLASPNTTNHVVVSHQIRVERGEVQLGGAKGPAIVCEKSLKKGFQTFFG